MSSDARIQSLRSDLPEGVRLHVAASEQANQVWHTPIQLLAVKPAARSGRRRRSGSGGRRALVDFRAGRCVIAAAAAFVPLHRCVRAVPNTPALVGAGLTALAWGDGISSEQRRSVLNLFSAVRGGPRPS